MNQWTNIHKKMPVLFIGHGSPMNAIDKNEYTGALEKLSEVLPSPRCILMISAHWETSGTWVTGMNSPSTIHDFFGFSEELYNVLYPAPGDSELSSELSSSISDPEIHIDQKSWGLDHGTWSVLKHLYPNADIPVVQLSLDMTKPIEYHFELGKKLRFLRDEGVMIIGSGNVVHNLMEIDWRHDAKVHRWATGFDEWVAERLLQRDFSSLVFDPRKTEAGRLSVPSWEHYLPMLYVIGAADADDKLTFEFEGFQNASLSMRSFCFSHSK